MPFSGSCNDRHTNNQQAKYLDLYETDLIDQEMFTGRIKELNAELERLMLQRNEMQEDIMKQSLSDKKSDGDVFVLKSKLSILRVSM